MLFTLIGYDDLFKKYFNTYKYMVYHIAYTKLNDHQLSEDVMQETFFKLSKNIDRLKTEDDVKYWLITVAGNCAKSALARKNNKTVLLEDIEEQAQSGGTEDAFIYQEMVNELNSVLDTLEPKYMELIVQKYYYNKTVREIARQFSIPYTTACYRLHRGLKILEQKLRGRGFDLRDLEGRR